MSAVETKMAEAATKENDKAFDAFSFLARFAPLIFLLLLMAIFAIMEPRFLSSINLFNVMRQVSITGLLAIGMTFVILTAGIDLSVGSLLAFAGLVAAAVAKGGMQDRFTVGDAAIGYGWPLAALSAILVGLACGFLQGLAESEELAQIWMRGINDFGALAPVEKLRLSSALGNAFRIFDTLYNYYIEGIIDAVITGTIALYDLKGLSIGSINRHFGPPSPRWYQSG